MARAALVFGGAPLRPTARLRARVASETAPYVVAADRGARAALAFGLRPDLVVGDMDSLDPATLAALRAAGTPVEALPRDKDATDGQVAIERALAVAPARLLLFGLLGGPRLDQALANVLLLARLPAEAVLLDHANECRLLRAGEEQRWSPERGEVVSLLPFGNDARGVWAEGFRWPLRDATLPLGTTHGVSNEPRARSLRVAVGHGSLLLVRHFGRTRRVR